MNLALRKYYPYWICIVLLGVLIVLLAIYISGRFNKGSSEPYEEIGDYIVIGGVVYNSEPYLDNVFQNIQRISKLFKKCSVVIGIDLGTDRSLEKLKKWNEKIDVHILEGTQKSDVRTENIANARNRVLDQMRELHKPQAFSHFIMMDCDDACSTPIQLNVLLNAFQQQNEWDAISFVGNATTVHSGKNYYDYWALSLPPYMISIFHYDEPHRVVLIPFKKFMEQKIKESRGKEWIPCYSAFNGFAVYRSQFLKYSYDWRFHEIIKYVPSELLEQSKSLGFHYNPDKQSSDCEHRVFHFKATLVDQARMYIIPDQLFQSRLFNR